MLVTGVLVERRARVAAGLLAWLAVAVPLRAQDFPLRDATPWHLAFGVSVVGDVEPRTPADVVRMARAEVALRRPARALSLLSGHFMPDSLEDGAPLAVRGAARYLLGDYREAGRLFAQAAKHAGGLRRGILHARAAAAFERAAVPAEAARLYRQAAVDVPEAAGWLALRQARLTADTEEALRLLHSAPAAGRVLAAEIRSVVLTESGDPDAAARALAEVGRYAAAGRLALAEADSLAARAWIYRAVSTRQREEALAGVEAAIEHLPPNGSAEHLAIARALDRFGTPAEAMEHAAAAFAAGDSSMATSLFLGQLMEASGDRRGAIGVYDAAVLRGGGDTGEAEYRSARGHLRLRERNVAYVAFRAFVERRAQHRRAPAAMFLTGDIRQDQGLMREADSLFRLLDATWPTDDFASQARSRLAARALLRHDTAAAVDIYRAEVEHDGPRAGAAQFQIARLARDAGDTATANREWGALARRDSIGYYGTVARQAAGLPEPVFAEPQGSAILDAVARELVVLDLLRAAGFERESALQVEFLVQPDSWGLSELMDIAEGLIERGEAHLAVNLGWRIASLHRLNDPRVLRIIFPWPNRDLIEREARKFRLDPYLMAALIRQESAFHADATSRAGARGMMQLMPATARGLARQLQLEWDSSFLGVADANVHLGAAHLATMLEQYDGEVVPALAAYNAGGSRVRRWLRFPEAGDWFLFIERVPFVETRGYLRTLLRNRALYEALYGESDRP